MRTSFVVLLALISLSLLTSCATSLVYAPSAHATGTYEKETVVLGGAISALPETIPSVAGRNMSPGAEGRLGYQFSDVVRIDGKYFISFNSASLNSADHGFGGVATFGSSSSSGIIGVLQGQFLLQSNEIEGGGVAAEVGYRWLLNDQFNVSAVGGPIFGYRDLDREWGGGAIINLGGGFEPAKNFVISVDAAIIAGYDAYTERTVTILTPSLMFSYGL